jgi:salicylate hydroxylase
LTPQIAALSQYPGIDVEIFESAEKLAEIGAGIGLFPRTRLPFNRARPFS